MTLAQVVAVAVLAAAVCRAAHVSVHLDGDLDAAVAQFATVAEARDALRNGLGANQPRTVLVHGVHELTETLTFDARDAGTPTAPITYKGMPGAGLSGGKQIPASAFAPAAVPSGAAGVVKTNLFKLGLNASVLGSFGNPYPSNQLALYLDTTPMTQARHPNIAADGTWIWSGYEDLPAVSADGMSFTFTDNATGTLLQQAVASKELWLHGFWKFDWRDTYVKIDSVTGGDGKFTVTRNATTPPQYPFTPKCRFYAVGALELLDSPGEYHVDQATGDMFFLPPAPLTAASNIVVSVLETAVSADGANNTVYRDLAIQYTRGTAAQLTNTHGVSVLNATVANAGGSCLVLSGYFSTVANSSLSGCAHSALSLSGGDESQLTFSNTSAVNNMIWDFARVQRTYNPGIGFNGVGLYVAHNTVRDGPHTGMTGGGLYHLFEYNTLYHLCFETIDVGAFYVGRSWSQRGNVVRYNHFERVRPEERLAQQSCSQNAFYLDDEMSGYEFYGNTIKNATTGILLGGGRRNHIHNNSFVDTDLGIEFDNRGMNWQAAYCRYDCESGGQQQPDCFRHQLEAIHYQSPPYSVAFPYLVNIFNDHPCVPVYNVIENNVFCNSTSSATFINQSPETIQSWLSTIANNTVQC